MPSPYDLPPGSSSDQPSLLPDLTPVRRAAAEASKRTAAQAERTPAPEAAPVNAVAQVLVDVGLMHLDRAFDYLVPATLHDRVVPGAGSRSASPAKTWMAMCWIASSAPSTPVDSLRCDEH